MFTSHLWPLGAMVPLSKVRDTSVESINSTLLMLVSYDKISCDLQVGRQQREAQIFLNIYLHCLLT